MTHSRPLFPGFEKITVTVDLVLTLSVVVGSGPKVAPVSRVLISYRSVCAPGRPPGLIGHPYGFVGVYGFTPLTTGRPLGGPRIVASVTLPSLSVPLVVRDGFNVSHGLRGGLSPRSALGWRRSELRGLLSAACAGAFSTDLVHDIRAWALAFASALGTLAHTL